MSVAILESNLDGVANSIGSGLPCSKTDTGHLIARVERKDRSARRVSVKVRAR